MNGAIISTPPTRLHGVHSDFTIFIIRVVEIKCQLDATDEFLLQILLFAQHVSGTIMPIIRSSGLRAAARKPEHFISTYYRRCTVKTTSNLLESC
jgi:hypothetical protein